MTLPKRETKAEGANFASWGVTKPRKRLCLSFLPKSVLLEPAAALKHIILGGLMVAAIAVTGTHPAMSKTTTVMEVEVRDGMMFSQDGRHVAYTVSGELYVDAKNVTADGGADTKSYQEVTMIEPSPIGSFFFGGRRGDDWYLVKDGKEIAEIGQLTSINKGQPHLSTYGERPGITVTRALTIWFAPTADSYLLVSYRDGAGNVMKDGDWLPLSFKTFGWQGFSLSEKGGRYTIAVSDGVNPNIYVDGKQWEQCDTWKDIGYIAVSGKFFCRSRSTLITENGPVAGYSDLTDDQIVMSADGAHIAGVVDGVAVVVDGRKEKKYSSVLWSGRKGELFASPGTFVWSKDFKSHAYVARAERNGPMIMVHDGVELGSSKEIADGSVSLSPDGKHVAYVVTDGGRSALAVDGQVGKWYKKVYRASFRNGAATVYPAQLEDGNWTIAGLAGLPEFADISPLSEGPDGHVAFAGRAPGGGWKVYIDDTPVSQEYTGILRWPGIRFDGAKTVRFVVLGNGKLSWVRAVKE